MGEAPSDCCDHWLVHGRGSFGLLWPLASAWARLLRFVFTRRSAFFELSYPRTHIFHVHNAIIVCLTQLLMNSDGFHATQMEESDYHALFFERKRRHWSISNTTVTRRRHKHSTGRTVLPFGIIQPKERPRHLQQLSRFYQLPFPRKKKLGDLRTWMHHVFSEKKSSTFLMFFGCFADRASQYNLSN